MNIDLRCGDSLEVLRDVPDCSIDACVTDPPYGLRFMGRRWDYDVPSVALWEQVLRVLKPGAHVLSFSSPRTYHRMVAAIEDAGFEIRDQLMWLFGSGFPKSLNVSKGVDRAAGAERAIVGTRDRYRDGHKRQELGNTGSEFLGLSNGDFPETAPATDEAKRWDGWGTALKPAHEPIVLARKPLVGTVAANVLEHCTGALNIDGCRVPVAGDDFEKIQAGVDAIRARGGSMENSWKNSSDLSGANPASPLGRWPANVLHDGSDEVVHMFQADAPGMNGGGHNVSGYERPGMLGGLQNAPNAHWVRADSGSAARFFYTAKTSRAERESGLDGMPPKQRDLSREEGAPGGENPRNRGARQVRNHHPTVKPLDLMRYLCRLITPPRGIVLDPFMGSGSTGWAANLEGFAFLGIDLDPEYVEIARRRIKGSAPLFDREEVAVTGPQQIELFGRTA